MSFDLPADLERDLARYAERTHVTPDEAAVRGKARRRGRTLPFPDCLVGASAERLGLPVATGDGAHFQAMIDAGLRVGVEDWRAA